MGTSLTGIWGDAQEGWGVLAWVKINVVGT